MKTIFSLVLLFTTLSISAQSSLTKCWIKQVKPIQENYLSYSFAENRNELGHNFEPWQQTNYLGKGSIWTNKSSFIKQDTLSRGDRNFYSSTIYNNTELLILDYGDKELLPITKEQFLYQIVKTTRYTPINILNYFFKNKIKESTESNSEFSVYSTTINQTRVKLFISKSDNLLQKVTTLYDDELFGDVLTTIQYSALVKTDKLYHPSNILINKTNGKVKDEIIISDILLSTSAPEILEKPAEYAFVEVPKVKPEISVERFNKNIHFIELKHTNDRVMVVEFLEFLLVAEAPLNSENGELIINESKKIAPNKPIKYFAFGHHHPHYLGGVRPFVSLGTKIVCSDANKEYLSYIVNAPHTLNPDRLQNKTQPLQIEYIKDSLIIDDGEFELAIYFIGKKSSHTNDYLIYYFPSINLLFQDDLVWVKKEGELQKAGKRQAGLYQAILDLNLDVDTIIQSWPINNHSIKTIIPFKELKDSVEKE